MQIAASLNEMDFAIDKRDILLDEPIRQLGVFDVEVGLHPEVTATIKVWVVKA
jgi:large subunit ribosomal protein L9